MKKTIKHADGTEEVFEGTAEELAEYEKNLNENGSAGKKKKNPKLLTEEQQFIERDKNWQEQIDKKLDDLARLPRCNPFPYFQPFPSFTPWWGIYPPVNIPYVQSDLHDSNWKWTTVTTTEVPVKIVGTDGEQFDIKLS